MELKLRRVPTMCKLSTSGMLILGEVLRCFFVDGFMVFLLGIEFYFWDELKFFFHIGQYVRWITSIIFTGFIVEK